MRISEHSRDTHFTSKLKNEIRMKIYESLALISYHFNLNPHDIKEDVLGIEIIRYDARTFEDYLNLHGELPTRD